MNDTKYSLLFLVLSGIFLLAGSFFIVAGQTFWGKAIPGLICCWYAVSCGWVSLAFGKRCPEMILGKSDNRVFSIGYLSINFPFLFTYWTVWIFRHAFLPKTPVNRIGDTNLSISQWPVWGVPRDSFDLVIDVSAEMPKFYRSRGRYLAIPNLDGVPLHRFELPCEVDREMRILVHCAQGRGRSAIMAALILLKLGYVATGDEAMAMIKKNRPAVQLSGKQMDQVRSWKG